MLQLSIIGNIGSNAVVREHNGRQFVSFNVAHNYQKTDNETGELLAEEKVWVSCIINGDGGKLFPFLVTGTLVYVLGTPKFALYRHQGEYRVDVSLSVDTIRLLPKPLTRKASQNLEILENVMREVERFGFDNFEEFFKKCEQKKVKK